MSEPTPNSPGGDRGWAAIAITFFIAGTAAIVVGYWAYRGLGEADTEAMESPLMMSVARQLVAGPSSLYGPYDGSNPLVLIHGPLYYRAAGLLAWPMARAGLHPITAARIAGRLISAMSLLATMAGAYRLGRLWGGSRRAGWWSALLLAGSPVLAGQPFAVRPDMLGVALQTWGASLALGSFGGGPRRLLGASVLFGLSVCVKQHLVAAWGVSAVIALASGLRGRTGLGSLVRVVLPGVAVAGMVYGVEWIITGGRVWDAAFVAAAHIGRVHPGGGDQILILFMAIFDRSAGAVALIAAGVLIGVANRPGIVGRVAIVAAWLTIGTVLAWASAFLYFNSAYYSGTTLFFVLVAVAALALLVGAATIRRLGSSAFVDSAMTGYLAAELALIAMLADTSAGAWINYGIPAAVFAAALAARAISAAVEAGTPRASRLAAVAASTIVLIAGLASIKEALWDAELARTLSGRIYASIGVPRSSIFFMGRPGFNRLDGRPELIYDDWLYPVFESAGLAEPRSRWLVRAIVTDPVRAVVCSSPETHIPGTSIDLRRLRYRHDISLEPHFYVWKR